LHRFTLKPCVAASGYLIGPCCQLGRALENAWLQKSNKFNGDIYR
jgi:hypothetical protein